MTPFEIEPDEEEEFEQEKKEHPEFTDEQIIEIVRDHHRQKVKSEKEPSSKREKMTEEKPQKKRARVSSPVTRAHSSGIGLWCMDCIKLELVGGRTSLVLAVIGSLHLNDFLHQAGLITDDAWNNCKGIATLFGNTANAVDIISAATNTVSTLVEGVTSLEEAGTAQTTQLAKLAAVKPPAAPGS